MTLRLDQTCPHCDTMPGIAAEALAATVAHDAAPSPELRQTALRLQSLVRRRQCCGRHADEFAAPAPPLILEADGDEYEYDGYDDDGYPYYEEEDQWGCLFPDRCLCPHFQHLQSECYTLEDVEEHDAYQRREARREWWQRFWARFLWWRKPRPVADTYDLDPVRRCGGDFVKALTAKQQAVLDFVLDYRLEHGKSPTVREIAREIGVSSSCTVQRQLDALERKGALRRERYRYRGLVPTAEFLPPCACGEPRILSDATGRGWCRPCALVALANVGGAA